MQDTPYKIFSASAGSGKTSTLVQEYLKIILRPGPPRKFRQILAITFTNKAVTEMKDRILNNLADFGQDPIPPKSSYMFHSLCEQLEMEPLALRERSRRVLKEILHNYAFFDIATIDRFNHRLIRTFARDLQLPQNFEVVLETDLLLDEAVNRLLNKAGKDNRLSAILIDFALEKTEDDKSWNISNDLLKIGKLVFEENHAAELKKLEGKSLEDFLQLKELLQKNKAKAEKDLASLAQLILDSVRAEGLEDTDFSGRYFPVFMEKIASGDLNIDFKAGWKKDFGQKPLYNKSATDSVKSSIDGLMPQLERGFEQIKSTFFHRAFLTNVLKHMVPLMVLNSIRKEVEALQKERDQLPISFFNTLISEAIRDQPAPFIYERLGEKYRHYFIDEFQDTSEMQWNNLVPLISNALESKDDQGKAGSLLLVGDAKQAIYRWRGGHAEQFMQLFNKTENPFVAVPSLQEKPTNYRSCREIIRFNNDFFTQTSRILGNPVYESMYLQGNSQQYNQKDGGYVSLQFVQGTEEEHQNDIYCREVKKAIEEVKEKNFSYSDLCILTRTKAQGILLADYLIEEGIPIISSETLLLANHDPVRFLVNLLRHCLAPDEQEISYEILSFLLKDTTEKYTITKRHLDSPGRYLSESYGFDTAFLREATVYDSLEYAVGKFDLAPASDAYITYLLDEALLVEQKTDGSIVTFLEHWDKKKDKLSIVAPESMDAIQIMTVHKAKGLEFPVVLYPFASTGIYPSSGRNETLLWLAVDPGQ
ncbi:UvrD-helicase domain-containing protein, partial [Zeaxanthinibacter enoshimensis]|uniref:UvrD-helicase domain-containing protein n=1 Tax=Zeaxanthinibacter enoshimensis TaxID=392009 RepID=UPI0035646FFD